MSWRDFVAGLGSRRRRAHRVGRRIGRTVRRRQDRDRDHRPHRPVACRGAARQAVRVRHGWRDRVVERPVLLFGLPGNPVSSAVTFELFVRPAIRALAGRHDLLRPIDRAVLGEPVSKSRGRRAFIRVIAEIDETGAPRARRAWPRRGPPRGRAGESRHLGRSPPQTPSRSSPRPTTAFLPALRSRLWWLDRA